MHTTTTPFTSASARSRQRRWTATARSPLLFCASFLLGAALHLSDPSAASFGFADAFSTGGTPLAIAVQHGGRKTILSGDANSGDLSLCRSTGGLNLFGRDTAEKDGGDAGSDSDGTTSDINRFDMAQRIESLKSVVLGALSGGFAVTPVAYLHYVLFASPSSTAQWEFVTDMSSLQAALFAIVYRYAVRANDNNPMLNQGVVGAFVVVRTLSNIHVTDTCQSIPLRCGAPLGYFDWNMIEQAAWGGIESAALFGAASLAMELAFRQKWISKFD